MEQFMLIFHGGSDDAQQRSPEAMQANMAKWMAWIEKLEKSGKYVSGEPLLPGGKIVSGSNGSVVTDGPFTEGKEVVGGFFIIKAKDMNEAVAICKDYPDFQTGGTIQVRQVMNVNEMVGK
ncbi:MAG TPA: YciI family protein [Chryseosolibacter sp.]|nr:YciI family protein [Chryseosolibacter sp.]